MPTLMHPSRPIEVFALVAALFVGLSACDSDSTSDPVSPPPPLPADETPRVPEEWDGLWAIRSDPAARGLGVIPPTFLVMVSGDELARTLGRLGGTVLPRDFVATEPPAVSGTWDAAGITATILEVGLIGSCASTRTTTVILTRDGTSFEGRVAVTEFVDESTARGCRSAVARFADVEGAFVRSAPQTSCGEDVAPVPAAWAGLWTAENASPFPSPCFAPESARGSVIVFCEGEDAIAELLQGPTETYVEVCAEVTDTIIDIAAIRQAADDESEFERIRLNRSDLKGSLARWRITETGGLPICEGQSFDIRLVDPDCLAPVSRVRGDVSD